MSVFTNIDTQDWQVTGLLPGEIRFHFLLLVTVSDGKARFSVGIVD